MRIVNGRKIPEAVDFANFGDSARAFDSIGDILEEVSDLLGSTVDGDDIAADAGVFAGALTVTGLMTGAAGLSLTGNAAISGQVTTNGISVNSGLISINSSAAFSTAVSSNSVGALSITGGTYGFETEAERTLVISKIEAMDTMLKALGLYTDAA